jgi:hypothetical protein
MSGKRGSRDPEFHASREDFDSRILGGARAAAERRLALPNLSFRVRYRKGSYPDPRSWNRVRRLTPSRKCGSACGRSHHIVVGLSQASSRVSEPVDPDRSSEQSSGRHLELRPSLRQRGRHPLRQPFRRSLSFPADRGRNTRQLRQSPEAAPFYSAQLPRRAGRLRQRRRIVLERNDRARSRTFDGVRGHGRSVAIQRWTQRGAGDPAANRIRVRCANSGILVEPRSQPTRTRGPATSGPGSHHDGDGRRTRYQPTHDSRSPQKPVPQNRHQGAK